MPGTSAGSGPGGAGAAVRERELAFPSDAPGTRRTVPVWCFGAPGARPKAYLQAAVHADEPPGLVVAHHLATRLAAAARAGEVRGEVVLVPMANPIGRAQALHDRVLGRLDLGTGGNFNRGYPDLAPEAARRLEGRLGPDAARNVALVREALRAALAAREPPRREVDRLRHALLAEAIDADVVLDLHSDAEAVLHVYLGTPAWPGGADLVAELGAEVTLLATVSGGYPFDEAAAGPWWALADRFAPAPVPPACLAATVELRGERDTDEASADADAAALVRFLRRRGVLAGDAGPCPAPRRRATPLTGVDPVRSPVAGVVAHVAALGASVAAGDLLAVVIDPTAWPGSGAARTELRARTAGVVFARAGQRLVAPGQVVCKVAGERALAHRREGALLTD